MHSSTQLHTHIAFSTHFPFNLFQLECNFHLFLKWHSGPFSWTLFCGALWVMGCLRNWVFYYLRIGRTIVAVLLKHRWSICCPLLLTRKTESCACVRQERHAAPQMLIMCWTTPIFCLLWWRSLAGATIYPWTIFSSPYREIDKNIRDNIR